MTALPSLTALRERAARILPPTVDAGAEPDPIVVEPGDPTATWFAAQTNPRCEVKAMHGVAALGWATFVPFGWKWSRPRHAPSDLLVVRRRPGMPGYVFFVAPRDARGDVRTSEVRAIDGVRGLVSQNGAPLKIRPPAIDILRQAEVVGAFDFNKAPGPGWEPAAGERVKISGGAIEGWLAIVVSRRNASDFEVRDVVFGSSLTVALDRLVPVALDS